MEPSRDIEKCATSKSSTALREISHKPLLEKFQRAHCAETGKCIFSDPLFRPWLYAGLVEAKQNCCGWLEHLAPVIPP